MRRILIENPDDEIALAGDDHRHFSLVKRAVVGDVAKATCGDGFVYDYRVTAITKTTTILEKFGVSKDESEPSIEVTLFMPVLKGDKNDLVVQKAVELGVKKVIPFVSSFSQGKSVRKERLNKIAREAVMQCGRSFIPQILDTVDFKSLNEYLKDCDFIVFPYEKEETVGIKEFLRKNRDKKKVGIIIGSEGGFSESEAKVLSEITTPVSLGKRILRAETACISVLAAVLYEFGEWRV